MFIKRMVSLLLAALLSLGAALPALAETVSQNPLIDPQTVEYADTADDIFNVLLLGLEQGFGTYLQSDAQNKPTLRECHTDVLMVLAINKTKQRIDLVSIPRDTLVYVPGIHGIYKVNAAFNLADTNEEGFERVKETVSWLLGGVKIDAYCAVDMLGLVTLGDAMGGLDFYMDMTYNSNGIQYYTGQQHLSGMGIMDYVRARKNASIDNDDLGRTRRGRSMITAIIQRLRGDQDLVRELWAVSQREDVTFLTDLTLDDVDSLWNDIQPFSDAVGSFCLTGYYGDGGLDWYFTYTNQEERQSALKAVYGISADPLPYISRQYTLWMQEKGGFRTSHNLRVARAVLQYAKAYEAPTAEMQKALDELENAYNVTVEAFDRAAGTLEEMDRLRMMYARTDMETQTEIVAKLFQYPDLVDWERAKEWDKDPLINDYYLLNWR